MDDPALFFDEDRLARARAMSATLNRNPPPLQAAGVPLGMPGAPQPQPQPQPSASAGGTAAPAAPPPDYRAQALKLMQQAAGAGEPTEEETSEGNRKLVLALALGAKGGEAMQPASGLILKQALGDPEAKAQRRQQRLESQAKIYESMAQHADTLAERERAAKAAADLRREMLAGQDQTRRDLAAQADQTRRDLANQADATRRDIAAGKQDAAAAKAAAGRPLPAHAVTDITKDEGKVAQFAGLLSSWKPEYGGLGTGAGNLSGRYNPLAGQGQRDQAQWWQNYQEFVNDMRHGQFGSALTPTEKAEFEKAIVTSDTDPRVVTAYLQRQKKLAEIAYQRRVQNYGRGGFDVSGFAGGAQPAQAGASGSWAQPGGGGDTSWSALPK